MNAAVRIRKEVEKWFIIEPLYFSVWLTHKSIQNPHIKNIRVGQGRIEYNPAFIDSLQNEQLAEVLLAEAMRIVLKHPYKRKKENPEICYLASNITLQEYLSTSLDFPKAKDVFHTSEWDRQYFELYYYKLIEQVQELEEYTNSGYALENTQNWDRDEFQTLLINDKIREAQQNDTWGNTAGKMSEMILATLIPQLNYKKILRHFRASILSNRRILTRMKPSRRYGFEFMGSKYNFCTSLLFAVDVSGSMSKKELQKGFSIINQIFRYGIEKVDVIQFDTQINGKVMELKKACKTVLAHGRGGTNFNEVINYINLHPTYDGLVIYTDGYAPTPPAPKNKHTKIVWLFNDQGNYEAMRTELGHLGKTAFVYD